MIIWQFFTCFIQDKDLDVYCTDIVVRSIAKVNYISLQKFERLEQEKKKQCTCEPVSK